MAAIGCFLALICASPCRALDGLAADCVRRFDGFRAPAAPADRKRRRAAGLTLRQKRYLARWGYTPYVLEEFRFHMTLTGPIEAGERPRAEDALDALFAAAVGQAWTLEAICLFEQARPDASFLLTQRFALVIRR